MLLGIVFSFAVGILFRLWIIFSLPILIGLSILFAVVFVFLFAIWKQKKIIFAIFLCIVSFSLGYIRMELTLEDTASVSLEKFIGEKVTLTGTIVDEPDEREFNVRFPLFVEEQSGEKITKPVTVLVSVDPLTHILYGDRVTVYGKLQKPEAFITDQGTTFDYASYLLKDKIYFLLPQATITVLAHNNGNRVRAFLFHIKAKIVEGFDKSVPVPENALLGGLVLGAKSAIPQDLRNDFVRTGTIHIVALSGYNVTIVALFFMRLFRTVLGEAAALYTGIFAIILFAIMTGGGATVVRASVMSIIALLARKSGRPFDAGRALIIAIAIMIMHNPFVLPYDISFQLSCLATLGLIYVTPITIKWFRFIPARFGFRELISATVATNIAVLPFIIWKMGILSLVTLPANILVLPIISITMLVGFLAGVMTLALPIFAYPFVLGAHILLAYQINVIHFFAQIPFAAVTIAHTPIFIVVGVYALLIFWVYRNSK